MTPLALALVLASAFMHAGWNILLKRSGDKQAFVWLMLATVTVLAFPLVAYLVAAGQTIPRAAWGWAALAACAEAVYYVSLGRAYSLGDMSVVYPIARGSGALLVAVLAALVLGERVSAVGALGIGTILGGLVAVHWPGPLLALRHPATRLALLTGLMISIYSTADKAAIGISPVIPYIYSQAAIPALLLAPYILATRRQALVAEWRESWRTAVVAGLATALTYSLVLLAMRHAKVSYVAAAREVNLVFGALLGLWVLKEQQGPARLAGAALIACGIAVLAFAR